MTERKLHISSTLSLPLSAVTETFAVLAKRGMGKTYTAAVMAEEMLKVGAQCVIADPVGVWWGLRVAADGKSPGLPIIVMGGEHGDIPLDETTGAIVAEFVVDTGSSVVLDLGLLRKGAMIRFMTDFAEKLYHAKAPEAKRSPLHLFLDEADAFAPQKPQPDQARLLGAMQDLVRRGRARGVGITMITQRSAVLNKDVLTQAEVLVPLRTISPQDRKAIEEWIDIHADKSEANTVLDSLPSLPKGTAWFWSPGWLNICQKVNVRKRETFDSSATPEFGKSYKNIQLAPVDLDKLKDRMAATIEKAKADDPKELKRQIADLKKQLSAKTPSTNTVERIVRVADFEAIDKALKDRDTDWMTAIAEFRQKSSEALDKMVFKAPLLMFKRRSPGPSVAPSVEAHRRAQAESPIYRKIFPSDKPPSNNNGNGNSSGLPVGERAVLIAVAQFGSIEREQLTVLTGYKRSSRDAYISRLVARDYINVAGRTLTPTQSGIDNLGTDYSPLPTGSALWDYWRNRLPEGELKIMTILVGRGQSVERSTLDDETGYKRSSRDAYLSRLMAKRLIEVPSSGMVSASSALFD
jgi:hypothetical protein